MSHSPVVGQDVSEAANGVDSPDSPDISDRPAPHALKCDGRTLQEDGLREGTQTETETQADTQADTRPISNNSTPHPNWSCTETPQTHATSPTDTHSDTPNTHADSPPKHKPHASEDLIDSVFTNTDVTDLEDTATKGRPHTETHNTERQRQDDTHSRSGSPTEDGVSEEEVNDRTEREDREQEEEEKAEVNISV